MGWHPCFSKKDANPRETRSSKSRSGEMLVAPDVVVALVLVLFVLEVGEHAGFDADGEVVRLEATDGDEAGRHFPAVEVARHRAVHGGKFLVLEVVTGRSRQSPGIVETDVAAEVEVVRKGVIVVKLFLVEARLPVTQ